MPQTKVYIDPRSRVLYATFYIKGLYEVFGKRNVSFASKYFTELKKADEAFSFEHYFAFVIKTNTTTQRVIIDFCDPPNISATAYNWCHAYAKINFNPTKTNPNFLEKLVHITPGFGIKIWNAPQTVLKSLSNYIKCKMAGFVFEKRYFKEYYHQFQRPYINQYTNKTKNVGNTSSNKPYVFMIASLWKDESCVKTTNWQRLAFVETCKAMNVDFEGGFWAEENHPDYNRFKEHAFLTPYPIADYITKTKASALVFNTPAVHLCHGWKMGEYLAMGKAIIATPFYNTFPEPLIHKNHVYTITDTNQLPEAIHELATNLVLREKLETAAQQYYTKYAQPKKVIEKIVSFLNNV